MANNDGEDTERHFCQTLEELKSVLGQSLAQEAHSPIPTVATCLFWLAPTLQVTIPQTITSRRTSRLGTPQKEPRRPLKSPVEKINADAHAKREISIRETFDDRLDQTLAQATQRVVSGTIVKAIQEVDGYKYYTRNIWTTTRGSRFNYTCGESKQSGKRKRSTTATKDNSESKTSTLVDCKGAVTLRFSKDDLAVEVTYTHSPIHRTISSPSPGLTERRSINEIPSAPGISSTPGEPSLPDISSAPGVSSASIIPSAPEIPSTPKASSPSVTPNWTVPPSGGVPGHQTPQTPQPASGLDHLPIDPQLSFSATGHAAPPILNKENHTLPYDLAAPKHAPISNNGAFHTGVLPSIESGQPPVPFSAYPPLDKPHFQGYHSLPRDGYTVNGTPLQEGVFEHRPGEAFSRPIKWQQQRVPADIAEQNSYKRIHRRTKTGCLTCRTRRVKCDEFRPMCTPCRKGNRQCSYPADPLADAQFLLQPQGLVPPATTYAPPAPVPPPPQESTRIDPHLNPQATTQYRPY